MSIRAAAAVALVVALICVPPTAAAAPGNPQPPGEQLALPDPDPPGPAPDEPTLLAPELELEPRELVAPGTLTATGMCFKPQSKPTDPGQVEFLAEDPIAVVLLLERTNVVTRVPLMSLGRFEATIPVPDGTSVGPHDVSATCVPTNSSVSAGFEVLAAPTLDLEPVSGPVGTEVTAIGTCRGSSTDPALFLDEEPVGTGQLDPDTGRFVAAFTVPAGAGLGPRDVTTDCDGFSTFSVLPGAKPQDPGADPENPGADPENPGADPEDPGADPEDPGSDPEGPGADPEDPGSDPSTVVVVVPDLNGLTEEAAAAELEPQLRLANPTGAEGRVIEQDPPAGTEVAAGTPVAVLLEPVAEPILIEDSTSSSLPSVLVAGGIAVLVLLAVIRVVWRETRRWRDPRWLRGVRPVMRLGEWQVPDGPGTAVSGLSVGFDLHRRPRELHFEEAGHARD